jgi:hypothetical protein
MGLAAVFLLTGNVAALPDEPDSGPTPPRLSLIDGQVSFWRPGATDWTTASLNTPLAPGDALYVGENGNLELQIGSQAYVRAGENTQFSLVNRERRYLQFRIADGQASIDLRTLPAGLIVEVDTPNAAFTINSAGYFRLNVDQDTTLFITRRGGRATVIPIGGQAFSVVPAAELIVAGTDAPTVETYAAPEPDAWDEWNYARTDHLADSPSRRYLPPEVYSADTLDRHGDWRAVPEYGAVWVPSGLAPNWTPYSTGHWIWDSFYGWTWIDDAPWGWAPFHYGRWVYLNGFWAWTPGTTVARPAYAPALVAFFNAHDGASIGIVAGVPVLSWVALSWGEPVIPWWGRHGFKGKPWWAGWGGPRVVNNVVIHRDAVVKASSITFRNTQVAKGMVAVRHDRFGHGRERPMAFSASERQRFTPVVGDLPVKPTAASLTIGTATSVSPPREVLSRPAVPLRAPPARSGTQPTGPERATPAPPPRFEDVRRPAAPSVMQPRETREQRVAPSRRVEVAPSAPPAIERERERNVPNRMEPPRAVETPRAREAPRAMEPPRAVETPRAREAPRAMEPPRAVETPRAREAPRAMEMPRAVVPSVRVAEPPRAVIRPEIAAPAVAPAPRVTPFRPPETRPPEARREEPGGRRFHESAQRGGGREQEQTLPGNPANRMSQRRHGSDESQRSR